MTIERRRHPRVKLIKWPARILVEEETIDGITRNISISGAFIYYSRPHGHDLPLRTHEQVGLVLEARDPKPLRISAAVAWSDILGSDERDTLLGVGLQFSDISPEDQQFLSDFVAKHSN